MFYVPRLHKTVFFCISLMVLIISDHFICRGRACRVEEKERNIMLLSSWVGVNSMDLLSSHLTRVSAEQDSQDVGSESMD